MKKASNHQFIKKWSPEIGAHGYTQVPILLVDYQADLGINNSELTVLLNLLSYMWDNKNPCPSAGTISAHSGMRLNTVRANIRKLHDKGLLVREFRRGDSSMYDLSPLKAKLQSYAQAGGHPTRKRIPPLSKFGQ